ncbi:hypothetical protein [Streptomyces longispororuber]|uniref:hypothetical protein n=1 Tax=Streptomyces longispororuber TaxID=68230 RepID=UPI002109737D|nr:hypothetical protein [Streptomyces longispororuber]MCQ4214709.1 hypothetical protein [Streptomyces longispororuber]
MGAGAILPCDGAVIGDGEWEGTTGVTLTPDDFPAGSVGSRVAGRGGLTPA